MSTPTPVVKVSNLKFSYGKNNVLDGTNITVPKGVIYALLGPSGCGKTTLLKIITGRIRLKSERNVLVFGQHPLSDDSSIPGPGVGYMPQEIGLSGTLTTKETLYLFGRLNGMTLPQIQSRTEHLCKTLDLTVKKSIISDLSGGQQRRVSLATALLHSPPLLILDEPTVGVDPLLRKRIWSYLRTLTATSNTTIIITTHYIDEAKSANLIGAMREGRVLIEDSPISIMKTFNEDSLENCFLKLCQVDSSKAQGEDVSSPIKMLHDTQTQVLNSVNSWETFQIPAIKQMPNFFQRMSILTKRNVLQWQRQLFLLLFTTFLPVTNISLFCIILGHGLFGIPIGIANEEGSTGMAEKFVKHLDKNFMEDRYYSGFEEGINSVRTAENFALVYMNKNFSKCHDQRTELGLDTENDTIRCSSISVYPDTTNQQIYLETYRSLLDTYKSFHREHLRDIGKNPEVARFPLEITSTVYGTLDATADEYVVPGIIVLNAHFIAALITCVKMFQERHSGLEERLWISRVSSLDLLFSHFLTDIGIVFLQIGFGLISAFGYFKLPLLGSIFTLWFLVLLQGIVGLLFGFLISILFADVSTALLALNFAMMSSLLMGGVIWPANGMDFVLKNISLYLPLTLPSEAVKNIMTKGFGFAHWSVFGGYLFTIAWGLIFVMASVLKLRLSR